MPRARRHRCRAGPGWIRMQAGTAVSTCRGPVAARGCRDLRHRCREPGEGRVVTGATPTGIPSEPPRHERGQFPRIGRDIYRKSCVPVHVLPYRLCVTFALCRCPNQRFPAGIVHSGDRPGRRLAIRAAGRANRWGWPHLPPGRARSAPGPSASCGPARSCCPFGPCRPVRHLRAVAPKKLSAPAFAFPPGGFAGILGSGIGN